MRAVRPLALPLCGAVSAAAVALAIAGSASSAPSIPAVTITPDSSCSVPSTCKKYDVSVSIPTSERPVNGVTIQLVPEAAITAFALTGQPAAKPTGAQSAWAIFPATLAPGASVQGTFNTATPLTASDVVKFGVTSDSFATFQSEDLHVQSAKVTATHAAPRFAGFVNVDLVGSEEGAWLYQGLYFGKKEVGKGAASHVELKISQGHPVTLTFAHPSTPPTFKPYVSLESFSGDGAGTVQVALAETDVSGRIVRGWAYDKKIGFRPGPPVWRNATKTGGVWSLASPILTPGTYVAEIRLAVPAASPSGRIEYFIQRTKEKLFIDRSVQANRIRFMLEATAYYN